MTAIYISSLVTTGGSSTAVDERLGAHFLFTRLSHVQGDVRCHKWRLVGVLRDEALQQWPGSNIPLSMISEIG